MYIAHKHIFETGVSGYLKMYAAQSLALLVSCVLTLRINGFVEAFAGKMAISVLVAAVVYLLFFFRTEEFKYFARLGRKFLHLSL
jgi:hypothetical protein